MLKNIFAPALIFFFVFSFSAESALFENKKISQALQGESLRVGMSRDDLVSVLGYPPDGSAKQGGLFYRFAQSKVTSAGKEESWTYQIGATVEGVRSVTFKIVDGKVAEWSEWLDTKK